jgi:putative DNA primase/helicase
MQAHQEETARVGIDSLLAGEQRYNDTYNADALIEAHGNELRYNKSLGWLVYDGTRWQADAEYAVVELAKQTLQQMLWRAADIPDSKARGALLAHINRSLNYDGLRYMVNAAKSDPRIRAKVEDFDADPWLLNVRNGTIDLRTGELNSHSPWDYITQLAPVKYDPDARSEEWEDFVLWAAGDREDLRDYLQMALGYSLTGTTGEKVFFYAYGNGNNGKTTLLEAVKYAMGDYADAVPIETVISKGGVSGDQTRDNVALVGKRFIIAIEPDAGQAFKMGRIKQITGGDSLPAKPLYKEQFSFTAQLKLWVGGNYKPSVPDSGNAAWSRIRLIPFDNSVSDDQKDQDKPRRLREAAPAILAWLVEGSCGGRQQGDW